MIEFAKIPGFSRYLISRDCVVINASTGNILRGNTAPRGYVHFGLTGDDGIKTTVGRHRLMAMTYKPTELPIDELYVNHINGIPGDDRPDNLEWCTALGNVEHAGLNGLTPKCLPVVVRDSASGAITQYPSATAAGRILGLSKDAVLARARTRGQKVFSDQMQYRFMTDADTWGYAPAGRARSVVVRSLESGQEWHFDSQREAAAHIAMVESTISNQIKSDRQNVLPGLFQVKAADSVWRPVGDPLGELEKFTGKRIVVVKQPSGELIYYHSAVEAARANGLKVTTLSERLKSNGKTIFADHKRYYYYNCRPYK